MSVANIDNHKDSFVGIIDYICYIKKTIKYQLSSFIVSERIDFEPQYRTDIITKESFLDAYSDMKISSYRLFLLALVYNVLNKIESSIPHSSVDDCMKVITDECVYNAFIKEVDDNYKGFDDETKDCLVFLGHQ